MPTALLAWELGGGVGHCVNLAPVAEGLLARGWDVWFAARDVTEAERVLRPLSVHYVQAPILLARPANPINPTRSFAHILHNVGFGDESQLNVLVNAWWNLMEMIQPDVVVCEHAPTALLASRRFAVRRVVLGTGFFSPPDVTQLPEMRYWAVSTDDQLAHDEGLICDRVNRLLSRNNLPPLERLAQLYADADANFLLTFAELDHYPQRFEGEFWGMWSRSQQKSPVWPDGDGPRIFAYLKKLPSSKDMSALLTVLREVHLPSLVYVPDGDPAWLAQFQSPLLRFTTAPVDIRQVARHCDLAILNGNAGTATDLLLNGVPQLHVPLYLEQEVFSRRVVDLGAALLAAPNRPEQFAVRLTTMIHGLDQFGEAAAKFAAKYAAFDAERSIAEIVSRIAE